jgi:transcriptional regulator with XRE-family HTH domain
MSREVVGNRIQVLRTMKGLTQEELAQRLGVSRQAVNTWEKGKVGIPRARREMLAAFFGIEADVLDEKEAEVVYDSSFPLLERERKKEADGISVTETWEKKEVCRKGRVEPMGISCVKTFAGRITQIRELLSEASTIDDPLELEMLGNILGWAKKKIDELAENLTVEKGKGEIDVRK